MRRCFDLLYLVALLLLSPWLLIRAWRTGRYRQGLRDKLRGLDVDVPTGGVWFHGVSVGEIHVLRQLVPAFRQAYPHLPVVLSATTDTGLAEARKLFPDLTVIPFPFDFSWAVERTLRRVRPALVVLCESELWPNFLLTARQLRVPVAVVNGRMSPRSLGRYRLVAGLVRHLFGRLDLIAVQEDEYAAAMLSLGGVPGRVLVTGNIKYDGAATDRDNSRTRAMRDRFVIEPTSLVWVVGSTQAPEEEVALAIYHKARARFPTLRLFLVPRQPDRFDEVARLIEKQQIAFARRSQMGDDPCDAPVVLVDTIGELGAIWGLADVAYVGGSLDGKRGGQNMIEPAAYGAAVTFGPHVWNFRQTARRLVEVGGAYQVDTAAELEQTTLRLLADGEERQAIGRQARAFVLRQQGATRRTVELLGKLLPVAAEQAA
ncbi:MAG: 3-deoxy-D-manno-octulosonic acid transferase [Gemmataceae bacterium]